MSTTAMFTNGVAIYNNGKIAIGKDLIFGLTYWDGQSWVPLKDLSQDDLHCAWVLIDNDPLFLWKEELGALFKKE